MSDKSTPSCHRTILFAKLGYIFEPSKQTSNFLRSQFVTLKKIRFLCSQIQKRMGNIKIIRGVKDAARWEDSETLAPYVKLLMDTSRFISSRIKDGTIVLVDKEIVGNLNFSRYEKK